MRHPESSRSNTLGVGMVVGALVGAVVLGIIGYSGSSEGWVAIQTGVSAVMGGIIGGVAGIVLGWTYERFFAPRGGKDDPP